MTDFWSERAEAYAESNTHREGRDLDLFVSWAEGETALDVATGGGHVARRLRELGFEVTTLDPAPGMRADVLAAAEDIPFADGSFDTVATRIAPHHFSDVRGAVVEMARVARRVVLVEDTLYDSELVEEAERLHDPRRSGARSSRAPVSRSRRSHSRKSRAASTPGVSGPAAWVRIARASGTCSATGSTSAESTPTRRS